MSVTPTNLSDRTQALVHCGSTSFLWPWEPRAVKLLRVGMLDDALLSFSCELADSTAGINMFLGYLHDFGGALYCPCG